MPRIRETVRSFPDGFHQDCDRDVLGPCNDHRTNCTPNRGLAICTFASLMRIDSSVASTPGSSARTHLAFPYDVAAVSIRHWPQRFRPPTVLGPNQSGICVGNLCLGKVDRGSEKDQPLATALSNEPVVPRKDLHLTTNRGRSFIKSQQVSIIEWLARKLRLIGDRQLDSATVGDQVGATTIGCLASSSNPPYRRRGSSRPSRTEQGQPEELSSCSSDATNRRSVPATTLDCGNNRAMRTVAISIICLLLAACAADSPVASRQRRHQLSEFCWSEM